MKRFAVVLFLFALVAQVSGRICSCVTESDEHSCCKRTVSTRSSISPPPCCDSDCAFIEKLDPQNRGSENHIRKLIGKVELEPSNKYSEDSLLLSRNRRPQINPVPKHRHTPAGSPRLYVRLPFTGHLEIDIACIHSGSICCR